MSRLLKAALKYRQLGFSVIPCRRDKHPFIKWAKYQKMPPTPDEIKEWWSKWPDANPAIVCGEVSGITVLDADSQDGYEALQEFVPDSLLIPTVKTFKGYHFYFKHIPNIPNNVHGLKDSDIKNDGGYVLAPPSRNNKGDYTWLRGLKITDVDTPSAPTMLIEVLSAVTHAYNNNIDSIPFMGCPVDNPPNTPPQLSTPSTSVHIDLSKGHRDESLFHIANSLVRGGMTEVNVRKCLEIVSGCCTPPFSQIETEAKIKSALERAKKREGVVALDVRELVLSTSGHISSTFVHACLQLSTRQEKKAASAALSRLVDEGILERTGQKAGEFRILDNDCLPVNWYDTECDPVKVFLPLELTDKVLISPGDIVLVAGGQNAGKSAFMMNVAKENRDKFKVHYFSSEMSASKFKRRMARFDSDLYDIAQKIKFYPRTENFSDVIVPGEGNLNIIDYLEMHDKFWLVAKYLADIFAKLDGAIAAVALQKQPGAEYGRGASFTQEKPVLSVSLDKGVATITKCKEFPDSIQNPEYGKFRFKLVQGCKFRREIQDLGWTKESQNVV